MDREELWEHVIAHEEELGVQHAMMPDDFLIWDNSATVHNREGWDESETRIMWHISAGGETPTPFHPKMGKNVAGMSETDVRKMAESQKIQEGAM